MVQSPFSIQLPEIASKSGFLSFLEEGDNLPINIKRSYWIYGGADQTTRGDHAHLNSDRIIICMYGSAHVVLENLTGEKSEFTLNNPSQALYFPRLHWNSITLSPGGILTVFVSCALKDDETIKDYLHFKQLTVSDFQ
jgi:WxcM-like, C-terminal